MACTYNGYNVTYSGPSPSLFPSAIPHFFRRRLKSNRICGAKNGIFGFGFDPHSLPRALSLPLCPDGLNQRVSLLLQRLLICSSLSINIFSHVVFWIPSLILSSATLLLIHHSIPFNLSNNKKKLGWTRSAQPKIGMNPPPLPLDPQTKYGLKGSHSHTFLSSFWSFTWGFSQIIFENICYLKIHL